MPHAAAFSSSLSSRLNHFFPAYSRLRFHPLYSIAAPDSSVPPPGTRYSNYYVDNGTGIDRNNIGILDFFGNILQQCSGGELIKQIHGQIKVMALSDSPFLVARLIAVYAKFGFLFDARNVFEDIFEPKGSVSGNMLLWNSILRANVMDGEYTEALKLYFRMRRTGTSPDSFGFPLVIKAIGGILMSDWGCKLAFNIHGCIVQMGYGRNLHVVNELLGMYGKLGRMDVAAKLFDRMPLRNQISWNTMVTGFANDFDCDSAYKVVSKMEVEGWEPNSVTWTSLLSSFCKCGRLEETLGLCKLIREKSNDFTAEAVAVVLSVCADTNAFHFGQSLHGCIIKEGFSNYVFVGNSLISMYGKNGSPEDANNTFSAMKSRNIVSWNALITSYAESSSCDEAFSVFSQLQKPEFCYPLLKPNVISWSSLIGAFAANERFDESLELFRQMQAADVSANSVTVASALTACAGLSALILGKQIHSHVIRGSMVKNMLVGNGLINMYMKCGSLIEANVLFDGLEIKDLYSWNTMIAGYAMLGLGDNALRLFYEMMNSGHRPDAVTFVGLLSACSHAGLVTQGRDLFNQMITDFSIKPQMEHYACMVDLLSRAGLAHEAFEVVRSMEMEPNECVWGALLNSCKAHKYTDAVEETVSRILGSEMTGSYMLLSNLYSASGKWEDSAKVRLSAKATGLKKLRGQSWIEVKKKVHAFSAGQTFDTEREEVHELLHFLRSQMEMENSVVSPFLPHEEYEA